jgi:hypothetical protein
MCGGVDVVHNDELNEPFSAPQYSIIPVGDFSGLLNVDQIC